MNFRVTSFSSSSQALRFASQYQANIHDYQRQISSGFRIERPSDDPVAYRQVSSLSVRLQELETEAFSIVDSESKLNATVSQLQETNNLLVRAKTLAQQGIQATTETERNALAVEAEGILVSLQDISNSQFSGAFLYSGTNSNQTPYEFDDPTVAGSTLDVNYQGSSSNSRAYIGDNLSFDTLIAGDEVFGQSNRTETLIHGNTGAAIGFGTDTLVGRATLQVRHTTTSYQGTSGIAAAANSAANDTLLGDFGQHELVVVDESGTGDFGTITLNGGTTVEWTSADAELQITARNGQSIFVDTTSIQPGFNGAVDFASLGTLSVDGGRTEIPIDFSESQTIVDSVTGKQTHIDTRGIDSVGDEFLEFPGTSDAFQVLYELAQDLRNTRGLDGHDTAAALDRRLGELGALSDHVLETVSRQSATLLTLDQLEIRVQDLQLDVETTLSELRSTDIPDAVLRLQNDQALLEFTYSITAQIASTSLIDFLR